MKRVVVCALALVMSISMVACGGSDNGAGNASAGAGASAGNNTEIVAEHDTQISEMLTYTGSMELDYADQYAVDYYENDYELITISDGSQYLLIPENGEKPEDLDAGIVCIQKPVENIYLVASAVMDMFVSIDALDTVGFCGMQEDSWYIDEVKEAMAADEIRYAGKYSAPDYEQIVAQGCGLTIENTMINHSPEIKEELEQFGIPVMVDYSSYESNPLGRCEWVKLYGVMVNKEEEAQAAYDAQAQAFAEIAGLEETGKTVAFFYITMNGEANVRKSSDYLPKMIEMAGGKYIYENLGGEDDTVSSTKTLQMEQFYADAKDADYIIYNSAIEGELNSVDELIAKSELFNDFKAVQEGHVYCTSKNLYQASMELGDLIKDISGMLHGDDADLKYMKKLD